MATMEGEAIIALTDKAARVAAVFSSAPPGPSGLATKAGLPLLSAAMTESRVVSPVGDTRAPATPAASSIAI